MSDHQYLNTEEAAAVLRISPATVRRWVNMNMLPSACYFKVGGTIRFRASHLHDLLRGDLDEELETQAEAAMREPDAPEQLELDFESKQREPAQPQTETGAPSVDEDY
jgi:excisionase family DNA binding protein